MSILNEPFEDSIATPHWSTGRWWLLRVGYYLLHRVKQLADDWVLFLDHSTQLGQERTLLILGIRLRNLPPSGQSLSLADMEVIDLVPVVKSDKRVVYQQLKADRGEDGRSSGHRPRLRWRLGRWVGVVSGRTSHDRRHLRHHPQGSVPA